MRCGVTTEMVQSAVGFQGGFPHSEEFVLGLRRRFRSRDELSWKRVVQVPQEGDGNAQLGSRPQVAPGKRDRRALWEEWGQPRALPGLTY